MPTAAVVPQDKYFLRSLHQEISLFDRKIAHTLTHETFPTEEARNAAAAKLTTKRNNLARTASGLVESGVEHKRSEVPASMRTGDELPVEAAPEPIEPEPVPVRAADAPTFQRTKSGFDLGEEIRRYMQDRKRA